MFPITRTPRLLVKLPAAPEQASFRFRNDQLHVGFRRLFDSIRPPTTGLGAASVPEWYVMAATGAAAEVNAWDLCHHVVTQGFGVAGLGPAELAEPDLEFQMKMAQRDLGFNYFGGSLEKREPFAMVHRGM
jgi:hypothetical protein